MGSLLVSWDVVSMFPNIDNDLGITAVRKALASRSSKFPSTDCIAEAVEICLLTLSYSTKIVLLIQKCYLSRKVLQM